MRGWQLRVKTMKAIAPSVDFYGLGSEISAYLGTGGWRVGRSHGLGGVASSSRDNRCLGNIQSCVEADDDAVGTAAEASALGLT